MLCKNVATIVPRRVGRSPTIRMSKRVPRNAGSAKRRACRSETLRPKSICRQIQSSRNCCWRRAIWQIIWGLKFFSSNFMFRFGLIAYLGLTTVFGPLVCCCSARELIGLLNSQRFWNTRASRSVVEGSRLSKKIRSDKADCCHKHSPKHGTSNRPENVPPYNEHDGSNCPCGQHQATLVTVAINDTDVKAPEGSDQFWTSLIASLPSINCVNCLATSINVHNPPAGLYGRDLLRAYQIMRC